MYYLESTSVSPWHIRLQVFKVANVHLHVQSCTSVPASGMHWYMRASCTRGCAFVYFPVAVQREELTNEGVAGLMEPEAQRKDRERQEEEQITGELKRFTTRKIERGFSLWGGTVGFWVTGPKHRTGQDRKVTAAVQNAVQCCRVIHEERKRAATQTSLSPFLQRVDRIESSKDQNPCHQRQAWGMLQLALCLLLLMVLQLCHLLPPLPPLPPPVSNASCPFTQCQSLHAGCCTFWRYCTGFSTYCTVRLKLFSLFFVSVFYVLCEKYYTPITVQSYIADCVIWVPWLTLLDLTNKLDSWTCS